MELSKAQLYRETYDAALAFDALKLWESYDDRVCFPVRLPGSPHLLFASVMGAGGQEYGLAVYRGADAGARILETVASPGMDDGMADAMDLVSFGMSPLHEIPPPGREFLRAAKVTAKRDDLVPLFIAKDPGKFARALSRGEVCDMLMLLRGLAKAHRGDLLVPSPVQPGALTREYAFSGDPRDPEIAVTEGLFPAALPARPLVVSPGELGRLPRIPAAYLIGYPVLPVGIEGSEDTVRALVLADLEDGTVLQGTIPDPPTLAGALSLLGGIFAGKNLRKQRGLPREAVFVDRELHDAFALTLTPLGVECRYEPGHPLFEDIKESMQEWMRSGRPEPTSAPARASATLEHPVAPPPAGDLDGWKQVDRRLGERLVEAFMTGRRPSDRAVARYFGTARVGWRFLEGSEREHTVGAFFEWAVQFYRATVDRPTAVERLLAGPLPEAERLLLAARGEARPSLHRIAAIEPGRVTLEDLLFGGSVVATDRLLAGSAQLGVCLAAATYAAGDFTFLVITGPPLGAGEVLPALRYLEGQGLDPSPEGIGATSHLFGRLWSWLERERAARPRVPQMVNFDGDPLLLHTAHYTVTDEVAARRALEARPDLDFNEGDGSYVWQLPAGKRAQQMPGDGPVSGGRLVFESGGLILETNSAERFRKARIWLDRIPGIGFSHFVTQSPEEIAAAAADAPRREQVPSAQLPAEALEAAQRMLDQHYLKWVDEQIPALGGRTPREHCRTEKGRREVAMMIRTMPDPGGMPGLRVPRARIFEALGLRE
ncbi:MAG: DUF7309 domain-containing protein [Candidatus Methylomirabilia bacterium]